VKIKALKALTIRVSESGDLVGSEDEAIGKLVSIAHGAIAEVPDTVGQSLIEDGLAEAYDDGSNDENFKKAVDRSITSITADMLEGVTNIKNAAFVYCDFLTSVEIPNSVTNIGVSAFRSCNSLMSIEIPNSVTNIGVSAFSSCRSLANVKMSNSVTNIGNSAFGSCSALTSIEIPNSVTSIGSNAFLGCSSLTSVTVLATTPPTLGAAVFPSSSDLKIYVPAESVEAYKAATNWSDYASKIYAIPS